MGPLTRKGPTLFPRELLCHLVGKRALDSAHIAFFERGRAASASATAMAITAKAIESRADARAKGAVVSSVGNTAAAITAAADPKLSGANLPMPLEKCLSDEADEGSGAAVACGNSEAIDAPPTSTDAAIVGTGATAAPSTIAVNTAHEESKARDNSTKEHVISTPSPSAVGGLSSSFESPNPRGDASDESADGVGTGDRANDTPNSAGLNWTPTAESTQWTPQSVTPNSQLKLELKASSAHTPTNLLADLSNQSHNVDNEGSDGLDRQTSAALGGGGDGGGGAYRAGSPGPTEAPSTPSQTPLATARPSSVPTPSSSFLSASLTAPIQPPPTPPPMPVDIGAVGHDTSGGSGGSGSTAGRVFHHSRSFETSFGNRETIDGEKPYRQHQGLVAP